MWTCVHELLGANFRKGYVDNVNEGSYYSFFRKGKSLTTKKSTLLRMHASMMSEVFDAAH
jgi:hypothetical protein